MTGEFDRQKVNLCGMSYRDVADKQNLSERDMILYIFSILTNGNSSSANNVNISEKKEG